MQTTYRVHFTVLKPDRKIDSYAQQGSDLRKVTRKAKKIADAIQSNNPDYQIGFHAFKAEFVEIPFPEDIAKEILDV